MKKLEQEAAKKNKELASKQKSADAKALKARLAQEAAEHKKAQEKIQKETDSSKAGAVANKAIAEKEKTIVQKELANALNLVATYKKSIVPNAKNPANNKKLAAQIAT